MESVLAEVIDNKLADTQSSVDKLKGFWDTEQHAATNTLGMSSADAKAQTQHQLDRILKRTLCQACSSGKSTLETFSRLIDLSISLAFQDLCLPDTPYSLFEDLFHLHTTEMYSRIWDLLEERTEALTDAKLFTRKSNIVLLRLANYLLRRVSQANHSVFCGRVMAFLSYAFPLSERSGVNVLGEHNVANSTKVQTEEEFSQVVNEFDEEEEDEEVEMDEEKGREKEKGNGKKQSGEEQPVDFTLYKHFWELQQDFVGSPHRTVLSSKEKWEAFLMRTDVVLKAFEGKPFSEADLQREMVAREEARKEPPADGDVEMAEADVDVAEKLRKEGGDFFPTKYLSNSRLLKLQLSDPTLRRNVLTQFMVLFQELSRSNVKAMAKVDASKPVGQYSVAKFLKRVEKLLRTTPPDGKGFVSLTRGILRREALWQKWKEDKCKAFEKEPVDQARDAKAFFEEFGAKRKQESAKIRRTLAENGRLWVNQVSNWEKEFEEEDHFTPPQPEPFLEQMFVAIDPENMIEDAYHPKHDPIYCWRGLRLLYRYKPQTMNVANKGSLETACIALRPPKSLASTAASPPESKDEEPVEQETSTEKKTEAVGDPDKDDAVEEEKVEPEPTKAADEKAKASAKKPKPKAKAKAKAKAKPTRTASSSKASSAAGDKSSAKAATGKGDSKAAGSTGKTVIPKTRAKRTPRGGTTGKGSSTKKRKIG